jgi:hypothetical protein
MYIWMFMAWLYNKKIIKCFSIDVCYRLALYGLLVFIDYRPTATLPEHLGSPPAFCGVRGTRSLVIFLLYNQAMNIQMYIA